MKLSCGIRPVELSDVALESRFPAFYDNNHLAARDDIGHIMDLVFVQFRLLLQQEAHAGRPFPILRSAHPRPPTHGQPPWGLKLVKM